MNGHSRRILFAGLIAVLFVGGLAAPARADRRHAPRHTNSGFYFSVSGHGYCGMDYRLGYGANWYPQGRYGYTYRAPRYHRGPFRGRGRGYASGRGFNNNRGRFNRQRGNRRGHRRGRH